MRFSRPCYDKPHRCPGVNGGGPKYARKIRCPGSAFVEYPRGMWLLGECPTCGVIVWPPKLLRWLAPSEVWWHLAHSWR